MSSQGMSALSDLGISHNQPSRAAIPEADFEQTFAQPDRKPSKTGLIAARQAKVQAGTTDRQDSLYEQGDEPGSGSVGSGASCSSATAPASRCLAASSA